MVVRPFTVVMFVVIVALSGVAIFFFERSTWATNNTTELCYFSSLLGQTGYADVISIKLSVVGDSVKGKLDFFPAGKDPVQGTILGTTTKNKEGRILDGLFSYYNGGVPTTEEKIIKFNSFEAYISEGDYVYNDDVYIYKNRNAITFPIQVPSVKCGAVQGHVD
jgi:hypothetical protein